MFWFRFSILEDFWNFFLQYDTFKSHTGTTLKRKGNCTLLVKHHPFDMNEKILRAVKTSAYLCGVHVWIRLWNIGLGSHSYFRCRKKFVFGALVGADKFRPRLWVEKTTKPLFCRKNNKPTLWQLTVFLTIFLRGAKKTQHHLTAEFLSCKIKWPETYWRSRSQFLMSWRCAVLCWNWWINVFCVGLWK